MLTSKPDNIQDHLGQAIYCFDLCRVPRVCELHAPKVTQLCAYRRGLQCVLFTIHFCKHDPIPLQTFARKSLSNPAYEVDQNPGCAVGYGTTLRAVLMASGSRLLGKAWSELWVIDKPDVRGRPLAGSSQDPPRTRGKLASDQFLTSCSVHWFCPVNNFVSGRLQKMKTCN